MANKKRNKQTGEEIEPCGNCGKNKWRTVSKEKGIFECRHCGRERNSFNKSI